MSNKIILVSIVSYKEYELENTVKEFYNKAFNKQNILFSIVSQSDTHPNLDFIPVNQIRYLQVAHDKTYGVTWARALATKMFTDFDLYLQIDAHMFPEENWDIKIINTYARAKKFFGKKIILTAIPAAYELDIINDKRLIYDNDHRYSDNKNTTLWEWPEIKFLEEEFKEIYYVQCACMFTDKITIDEIEIDPNIGFAGEEITYSIRCFANNYKIITFKNPIFYHIFADKRKEAGIYVNPWENNDTSLNIYADSNKRLYDFFRINIFNKFGVSQKQADAYCQKTGFIWPTL